MPAYSDAESGADLRGLPRLFLSARQVAVLELAAAGYTDRQVAQALGLQMPTVRGYLRRACARLRAVNKTQAVARALALRLIGLDVREILAEVQNISQENLY